MKTLMMILVLAVAGCEGGYGDETGSDAGADEGEGEGKDGGGVLKLDGGDLYTPSGVRANLGANPCADFVKHWECKGADDFVHCGWDPSSGACYPAVDDSLPKICAQVDWCAVAKEMSAAKITTKTYAVGTIKVWGADANHYLGNPNGLHPLGSVCLPNKQPVVVTSRSLLNYISIACR
jgi:hypothetical protein